MPRFLPLLAALALSPLLGWGGCDMTSDLSCTEIGCSDGYTVSLVAADRFPDGVYEVALTAEGATDACRFEVAGGRVLTGETCNAVYGIGPTYPTPEAVGILYPLIESEVRVVVTQDGTAIGDVTATPAVETVQPNGPDCPPVCRVASTRIAVPSP